MSIPVKPVCCQQRSSSEQRTGTGSEGTVTGYSKSKKCPSFPSAPVPKLGLPLISDCPTDSQPPMTLTTTAQDYASRCQSSPSRFGGSFGPLGNMPRILVVGARTRMLLCYLIVTHKYQFPAPKWPQIFPPKTTRGKKVSKLKN